MTRLRRSSLVVRGGPWPWPAWACSPGPRSWPSTRPSMPSSPSFGRVVAVHGLEPGTAGLHFKRPWQGVVRVDRRIRVVRPAAARGDHGRQAEPRGRRRIVVYRVADPVRFLRGSGSLDQAEARLNERVSAALSDAIGRRDLAALATTDSRKWALDEPDPRGGRRRWLRRHGAELGIEVLDLGLRRFNHPLEVRPAVFDLIRSERRQVAARLRAEGEAQYTDDHQPGRPDARRDPRPGRRRGGADPRPGPGRVDADPQRGPRPRSEVLRAPPHARIVRVDPRRQDHDRPLVVEPAAEAADAAARAKSRSPRSRGPAAEASTALSSKLRGTNP